MRTPVLRMLAFALTLLLSGCGSAGSFTTGGFVTPQLVGLSVSAPETRLRAGNQENLEAIAIYSDGSIDNVTDDVDWSSSDSDVATVDSEGSLLARAVGSTVVTASYGELTDQLQIVVESATVASVEVSPLSFQLPAGLRQPFHATAIYTDGTKYDVTAESTWSSSDTAIATVDAAGVVTAVSAGGCNITATFQGVQGLSPLTVTSAVLQSIEVEPSEVTLPLGSTQQFEAIGFYSDGTEQDLTDDVSWSSSADSIIRIDGDGFATTESEGPAQIRATLGGVQGVSDVTVTSPSLDSITVTPADETVPLGYSVQYTATGTYSDGSTADLTQEATWTSSNTSVASVSNQAADRGLASTVGTGATRITAVYQGVSDGTNLTVSAAELQSITVTPADANVIIGAQLPFTATGTYSDGSTEDLTTRAVWSSSDQSVAVISNALPIAGWAEALGGGVTTITATSGTVSGNTLLFSNAALIGSIVVTPANVELRAGEFQQFTATAVVVGGLFSFDVTYFVRWSSSDRSVGRVSNLFFLKGFGYAKGPGTATISASIFGVTGSTFMVVDN